MALGHRTKMSCNAREAWIFSPRQVHAALISEEIFDQTVEAIRDRGEKDVTGNRERAPRRSARAYLLRGVISCAPCVSGCGEAGGS